VYVEARDLLLIGFGALVLLLLTRLPRPALPIDRSSLDALVEQLTIAQERVQTAEGWAREAEARAERAETKTAQLQAMVDNLLPAASTDRTTIAALREQLHERSQEVDGMKAGLGLR
jgi:predicted S18 family serine protease